MNKLFFEGREVSRCEDLSIYKSDGLNREGNVILIKKTYKEYVVEKIREKYSIDDEMAILRQQNTKPSEFYEYNNYVEQCKIEAKAKFNL